MKYVAVLQRFDDAHVDVALGDDRAEVVAAATAVYVALVPTILGRGIDQLRADRLQMEPDEMEQHDAMLRGDNELSMQLQAREWGVGVYERVLSSAAGEPKSEMVFWIGATRERPST